MGGNCSYFPFFSGMGGGFFPGGIWSLLIWALVLAGLVYLGIRLFRFSDTQKSSHSRDTRDSIEIAKARYARGEINEEEYHRMLEVLQRS